MRVKQQLLGVFALGTVAVLAGLAAKSDFHRPAPTPATWFQAKRPVAEATVVVPLSQNSLAEIRRRGKLVVLTRNAPTTYYVGSQGEQGLEFELAKAFADHLGVGLEIKLFDSAGDIVEAIKSGEGNLAAAGLPADLLKGATGIIAGPRYQTIQQELVCRKGLNAGLPKSVDQLSGLHVVVEEGGGYEDRLRQLSIAHPDLAWETSDLSIDQILDSVSRDEIDCTVADSNAVKVAQRYDPDLIQVFPLSEPMDLVWALPVANSDLEDAVTRWMDGWRKDGRLAALVERYYGNVKPFDVVDMQMFQRGLDKRLPRFRKHFERAADETTVPWTVLAAMAYQESRWEPHAQSHTGVRGMMMLTNLTAGELGVGNRLDPVQSIRGGARYLAQLLERVPESVRGQDRLWYALAAYNVGMAHMHDAQQLARRQGKSANSWHDLRTVLPLLSKRQYYKTTKYGYARGMEPVRFVDRIRDFLNILDQHLVEQEEAPPQFDAAQLTPSRSMGPALARLAPTTSTVLLD